MDKKILAIIPARAGSKRVVKKNFRAFADTTLTDLAIQQALESSLVDTIVVNSDSNEVKEIASKYNKTQFLQRPKELASDKSPAIDYILHTINHFSKKSIMFDLVVIIQPSSPLRSGLDIDNTIKLLLENYEADSSVSIVKIEHMLHPHKIKRFQNNILLPWIIEEENKTSSHEIPSLYVRNCAVYVFKTKNLEEGVTFGNKCLGYLMPSETSVDINEMVDFKFAEYLIKNKI